MQPTSCRLAGGSLPPPAPPLALLCVPQEGPLKDEPPVNATIHSVSSDNHTSSIHYEEEPTLTS
jgi:hypothetical protein